MTVSNYDMAHECMNNAESDGTRDFPVIEAMAAQTYATLAIVDELRAQRQGIRDTVAEEVSDARGSGDDARYLVARNKKHAMQMYLRKWDYPNYEAAAASPMPEGADVYRVSVEVVQS